MMDRNLIIVPVLILLLVIGAAIFYFAGKEPAPPDLTPLPDTGEEPATDTAAPVVTVVGGSVEGRPIEAYTFGSGAQKLLFVGGMHGGYEWNSVVLAYDMIDYLQANPLLIPETVTVAIIPNLNPDAVFAVVGKEGRFAATDVVATETELAAARFNSNDVDLNRNFDCKWAPESSWRGQTVSAGSHAFSEPEAAALRDFVLSFDPSAAIFWHSQANTVYASECEEGIIPETLALMDTYATAASYNTQAVFDAYAITGDAEGWLASIGVPAITVEMQTRTATDWDRNLRGVLALFNHYNSGLAR